MPHVTFSNDVSKVDGHAVTIVEQRSTGDSQQITASSDPFVGRSIALGDVDNSNDVCITHHDETLHNKQVADNLVVRMGILKCGYRYHVTVPIPRLIGRSCSENDVNDGIGHLSISQQSSDIANGNSNRVETRILRVDDEDLRCEVNDNQHVDVTLSARQRGPYLGRLLIEQHPELPISALSNTNTPLAQQTTAKYMSIQIEASIMGKGMGTPQLRNGVACLGKLVGYDSDEETEWQGFG
jgi:hypothetical protein